MLLDLIGILLHIFYKEMFENGCVKMPSTKMREFNSLLEGAFELTEA